MALVLGCAPAAPPPPPAPAPTGSAALATASTSSATPSGPPRCPAHEARDDAKAACEGKAADCLVKLAGKRLAEGAERGAADLLAAAIQQEPGESFAYGDLADLLIVNDELELAMAVLHEAKRFVPPSKQLTVHVMLSNVYQMQRNKAASVAELEAARQLTDQPMLLFNLGMSYLTLSPPRKGDAVRELQAFSSAACGGTVSQDAQPLCEQTAAALSRLQGTSASPAKPPEPRPIPPALCVAAEGQPAVPELAWPQRAFKKGDAYTVFGAAHHLRGRRQRSEVISGPIAIEGYIVATNYHEVPACAVHKLGKADPPGCVAPVPTFRLADEPDGAPGVAVMGWASNWAAVYAMMTAIDARGAEASITDVYLMVELPNPIPHTGAKVRIEGTYGVSYATGGGSAADPHYGILAASKIVYLSPPKGRATLPGMSRP